MSMTLQPVDINPWTSAADKAGLKEYDIILEFAGQKVTQEKLLTDILQECQIGDNIPLLVMRDNQKISLAITLLEKKTC